MPGPVNISFADQAGTFCEVGWHNATVSSSNKGSEKNAMLGFVVTSFQDQARTKSSSLLAIS